MINFIYIFTTFLLIILCVFSFGEMIKTKNTEVLEEEHKKYHLILLFSSIFIPIYFLLSILNKNYLSEFLKDNWIILNLYFIVSIYKIIHLREERLGLCNIQTNINLKYIYKISIDYIKTIESTFFNLK